MPGYEGRGEPTPEFEQEKKQWRRAGHHKDSDAPPLFIILKSEIFPKK